MPVGEEDRGWLCALAVLVVVSACLLALRAAGRSFLAPEFELAVVYFPTALAGAVVLRLFTRKG